MDKGRIPPLLTSGNPGMELWALSGCWVLAAGRWLWALGVSCLRALRASELHTYSCQVVLLAATADLANRIMHVQVPASVRYGTDCPSVSRRATIVWLRQRTVGLWLERTQL